MRQNLFAAAAALGLVLAVPAFAQTAGSGGTPGTSAMPGTSSGSQSQAQQQQPMQQRMRPMTQDEIRQQLSQAGFQDVRIVDEAFLVQARTRDGHHVMMMINPPQMPLTASQGGMMPGSGQGDSATGSNGGMPGQGASGSGGPGSGSPPMGGTR